uniref:Elongation of very long chain fatty acids protein n=1 Tax=Caligus clemensi TaxID=344056 RepID=C1C0M9_CALCM|nr:Elongation of very long chain fatty acids protein AAEL008004 [Caligus clemensi]
MIDFYSQMWEVRDKRADHLPLMGSIWSTIVLCLAYTYFSKIWGPRFMKHREAMEFKGLMNAYNTVQVVSCMIMWINTWRGGWLGEYNWLGQNVDPNPEPGSSAILMLMTCYYFYLSKLLDFVDTIFFVIRKKNSQITNLHVIHHAIMPVYTWIAVRWVPGGQETFVALINCFIHVLMYGYYFLSSLGPAVKPYLWWKKYLTSLQMMQFIVIGIKCTLVVAGVVSCGYPWEWSLVTLVLMVMFYHLFNEFYKASYLASKSKLNGVKSK